MLSNLRTMLLAGFLATGLLAGGASKAQAQFVAVTPGFGLSIGNTYGYPGYGYGHPGYGYGYPGAYGVAPGVVYPAPVYGPQHRGGYYNRGYGYGYGYGRGYRPGYYGGHPGPYRRW